MRPLASTSHRLEMTQPPAAVDVLGLRLAAGGYEQTLDWIDAMVGARRRGYICTCYVDTLIGARRDPELWASLRGASLCLPAGQPLAWAMGVLGTGRGALATSRPTRVSGGELMSRACARAADTGHRYYLYGGRTQGTMIQLALNLRQRHPGVKIVGGYSPPGRPPTEEEQAAIAEEINHSRADVVWVRMASPEQEKWMAQMRERLEAPVLVGVGPARSATRHARPRIPAYRTARARRIRLSRGGPAAA